MKIIREILLSIIIILTFTKPVFAEAGLSEAGRTVYYFWDEQYAISILPGGEGANGEDRVNFFQYEEIEKREDSQSGKIKGEDGKIYITSTDENTININFYEPPRIYRNIIWGGSIIMNFKTKEVLYEEYFDCIENPNEDYYEYDINGVECAEYRKVMEENNLSFDNPENITLNLEYAEENLEYMGRDAFFDDIGQGLVIFFVLFGISLISTLTGLLLLIIGTVFMIKKKNGLKLLIIGAILFFVPGPISIFISVFLKVFFFQLLQ